MNPAETLEAYFAETMSGDLSAVDRYFHPSPDYVLIAETNASLRSRMPWVGRQTDRDGIKRAYGALLDALEVCAVSPGATLVQGEDVAVFGSFSYRARATGMTTDSLWAVHAVVSGDLIVKYQFIEDSQAVASILES